ncbi:zinc-ribbon domain-containing protein [Desulfobacula toluolica]|uniref:Zinc finger/thioredoxin domain protein n=1 Tax=Desulfobacula toluolica (strain DSM 7467 / Tol2) TaxID=651182 RepID=K0NSE9_DESTT|nr:zinc-ribbon domain-containing protein [Desulfobacula toluolica]CCK81907.1 zinc finger/thioredoxin domain protein [Desulfobacula toluolica Tol2]
MIITCTKCSTSFKLDDSLVKPGGSKVRCSVCKDIFTAYPLPAETEQAPEESQDFNLEFDPDDEKNIEDTSDFETEDIDFSLNDSDLSMESPDLKIEGTDFEPQELDLETDDDFSFEETEFESNEDDESQDLELEESNLDFEDDESYELELEENHLALEDDDFQEFEIDEGPLEFEDEQSQKLELDENHLEFEDDQSQELELGEGRLDFGDESIDFEDSPEKDFDGIDFDGIEFETVKDEKVEDGPASLAMANSEPVLKMENETDELTLDEADFELEFDIEDDSENETPDILDDETEQSHFEIATEPDRIETDQIEPDQIESDQEDSILSLEETDAGKEEEVPPVITLEDDFSEYDDVLEQETEPEDDFLDKKAIRAKETIKDEETMGTDDTMGVKTVLVEEPEPIMDKPSETKQKTKSLGAFALVLVLIFLLFISANIAGIMTGYKIPYISDIKLPYIEQLLKKPAPEIPEAKPVPNQESVNGRFITNSTAGTLFIITGRVENPSTVALSHIEIRGALITKDKLEAKTKNAFCGNIITEEMLKTGNISDINTLLAVKEGVHDTNINVKPGASIPFMVVFSDLPENLQNFTVKVTGFEK